MTSVRRFLQERLRLRVNEKKSAVDRPWRRKFLGFSMYKGRKVGIRLAPESIRRMKDRLREMTRRSRSQNLKERVRRISVYLRGWVGYFALADAGKVLGDIEGWLRHRLRACVWEQWKRPRTKPRELRSLGLPEWVAWQCAMSRKGPWRMSGGPLHQALCKIGKRQIVPTCETAAPPETIIPRTVQGRIVS